MFSEPVIKQLRECVQIAVSEPSGDTADSLLHALDILLGAEYLYCDGGLSFGGVLPGGIAFGMIERTRPNGATYWTFHS